MRGQFDLLSRVLRMARSSEGVTAKQASEALGISNGYALVILERLRALGELDRHQASPLRVQSPGKAPWVYTTPDGSRSPDAESLGMDCVVCGEPAERDGLCPACLEQHDAEVRELMESWPATP